MCGLEINVSTAVGCVTMQLGADARGLYECW